ncbi:MAG: sulfotransferase domain-containing protein [Deltaproteobacteria bacterium]|nr:sulfotransferase domain-containing protein [Deltaproteobacteria bacterium]
MRLSVTHFPLRLWELATAWGRGLPGLFIIGAQKAGTSSLFRYLEQHPALGASSRMKEPNFFEKRHRRSLYWYRSLFPWADGDRLFFEGSTNYLFHPQAAQRLAGVFPEARMIAILRDPVERAFSHYQHMLRVGEETLDFAGALASEEERLAGEEERLLENPGYFSRAHRNFSYKARGRYLEQIRRWHEHFPPERLFIASSEEFFSDPAATLEDICHWLEIPPHAPASTRRFNTGSYSDAIPPETRNSLSRYFSPFNHELYQYLGRDFGWQEEGNITETCPPENK